MIKLNKIWIRRTAWSLAGASLLVVLGFSSGRQHDRACKGLRISIADQTGHFFIEPSDILDVLNSRGKKIKGTPMRDINMAMLEKIVYSNAFVRRAEVYSSIDGYVHIDVWQREPLVRIVNFDNEHFYIDNTGAFMPVSNKYSSQVVVASGQIFDDYAERSIQYAVPSRRDTMVIPVLRQVYQLAGYLHEHPFWDAQIEQIYVNQAGEIELVPRVGAHTVLLGSTMNLDEKMKNLFVFYNQGLNNAGWDNYSYINLKFSDQVIATRSATYKPAGGESKKQNNNH